VSLIKSISGIRGTIGGKPGENLSPLDVVKFSAAFGTVILKNAKRNNSIDSIQIEWYKAFSNHGFSSKSITYLYET
jgi:hypothetical protein